VDVEPLIVILGPTATGKSDVAVRVARRLGGCIISADSIQVYRGLEAGSCKPPLEARREIPHSLIDVADPREPFSAGRFARLASEAIEACRQAGRVPIVAGGTGLYLKALLEGIAPMPPRDDRVRRELYARASAASPEELHRELAARDPETARRIGERDLQRVVRALEVLQLTGVPLSRHIGLAAFRPEALPALKVGLTMERPLLYLRVDERVERIFAAGIVEEVRALLAAGVPAGANALKALGYREVISHLRGEIDLPRAVDLVKRNTRRYARRQIIWFRRECNVRWFDAGVLSPEEIAGRVAAIHEGTESGGQGGGV
jgi:tRNA dimethylallyltransferase